MGILDNLKKDKKPVEPINFGEKPKEDEPPKPPEEIKTQTISNKLADTLSFIYESITNTDIQLNDFEWSAKITDTQKLVVKIESV